jgi:hypothetical protein
LDSACLISNSCAVFISFEARVLDGQWLGITLRSTRAHAPSPAATNALEIAKYVADEV